VGRYRRILLHAGLSKTGSTSIQASCARRAGPWREEGVEYPPFVWRDEAHDNHSLPLTLAAAAAPQRYIPGLRQRFGDDLPALVEHGRRWLDALLAAGGDTLLLSTELLENFDGGDAGGLRRRLAAHCDELQVLACIRSPRDGLESLLQERLKAGVVLQPGDLVGRTRRKVENLQAGFGGALRLLNYHELYRQPGGLVGAFLAAAGLPPGRDDATGSPVDNPRMSMACYQLMRALNEAFPRQRVAEHGVARHPQDLNVLLELPGEPLCLDGEVGADVEAGLREEAAWLAARLDSPLPVHTPRAPAQPWCAQALAVLPAVLARLEPAALRRAAGVFLAAEAAALAASYPDTAARLRAVAADPGRA